MKFASVLLLVMVTGSNSMVVQSDDDEMDHAHYVQSMRGAPYKKDKEHVKKLYNDNKNKSRRPFKWELYATEPKDGNKIYPCGSGGMRYEDVDQQEYNNGEVLSKLPRSERGDPQTKFVMQQTDRACCTKKSVTGAAAYIKKGDKRCACLHQGEVAGLNNGLSCCSHVLDSNNKCAGIPPLGRNQPFLIDGRYLLRLEPKDCEFPIGKKLFEENTCCKARLDSIWNKGRVDVKDAQMCGPASCQEAGLKPTKDKPICCGSKKTLSNSSLSPDDKTKVCGCTPFGIDHDKRINSEARHCCSGAYKTLRQCSCIPAHKQLPEHASATDCCSKNTTERDGIKYCAEDVCTTQGKTISNNGSFCCSRTSNDKKLKTLGTKCPCVSAGSKPVDNNAERCCSQKTDKEGKCTYLKIGDQVEDWFPEQEGECFSGEMDKDKKCTCMAPLSKKRDKTLLSGFEDQCCSNSLVQEQKSDYHGYCSCVSHGDSLTNGAKSTHCCSGAAEGGTCMCAAPGFPFKHAEGMVKGDCCSNLASVTHCLCSPSGSKNGKACCAGDADEKCSCIPDGDRIPTQERKNPSAVCCSNKTAKCATQCGR